MASDWSRKACYICHSDIVLVRSIRSPHPVLIGHFEPNGMRCLASGALGAWYVPQLPPEPNEQVRLL